MGILKRFGRRHRKYPIQWDESGKSARQRCFELFEQSVPLQDVARILHIKLRTVYKYHSQWQAGSHLEKRHAFLKLLLDPKAPDRDDNLTILARLFGVDREELGAILARPHGLKRLIAGKIPLPSDAELSHKRHIALAIGEIIAAHLTINEGKPDDVLYALEELMAKGQYFREEEERRIAFLRQVAELIRQREKDGKRMSDRLTKEERDAIFRYARAAKRKQTEAGYWINIASMVTKEGITVEQAREKMYQVYLNAGDPELARMFRAFQDEIHPLKPGDTPPPTAV